MTRHKIGGSLSGENALGVVVHNTVIGRGASLKGGGGGVSYSGSLSALSGAPPYADFEDNIIAGNLSIEGFESCFLGVIRNAITHNFELEDSVNADPDGNELADNRVAGDLNCKGDSPSPQIGDSGGGLNRVSGHANGQCANAALIQ